VLAALALHVLLIAAWLQRGPASRSSRGKEYGEQATLTLRMHTGNYPDELRGRPWTAEDEREIRELREKLHSEFSAGHPLEEWEGSYRLGSPLTSMDLLISSESFVSDRTDSEGASTESGSVTVHSGALVLQIRKGPFEVWPETEADVVLERTAPAACEYIWTRWNGDEYLVEPGDMRDFISRANSGSMLDVSFGSPYLRKQANEALAEPKIAAVPEGYYTYWSSLPHWEATRVIEPSATTARLVEIEGFEGTREPGGQLTLYWDGDPSGRIRAIEREWRGHTLIAAVDVAQGVDGAGVVAGAKFSRLPRLE